MYVYSEPILIINESIFVGMFFKITPKFETCDYKTLSIDKWPTNKSDFLNKFLSKWKWEFHCKEHVTRLIIHSTRECTR